MKSLRNIWCCFLLCLAIQAHALEVNSVEARRFENSLRKIGHQFLLGLQDSSSRVMPVELMEDGRYRISFENEITFEPSTLAPLLYEELSDGSFGEAFLLEVESCDSNRRMYSLEVMTGQETYDGQCGGRTLPADCYNFFITVIKDQKQSIIDPLNVAHRNQDLNSQSNNSTSKVPFALQIISMLLIGLSIYFVLQKRSQKISGDELAIGEYRFSPSKMTLAFREDFQELSAKESELLALLSGSINETIKRDYMLNRVWGDEGAYVGRTLDVFVSKLRKKLELDQKISIKNIRGVGYRLIVENK